MKKDDFFLKNGFIPPRMFEKKDLLALYMNSGTVYLDKQKFAVLLNTAEKNESGRKTTLRKQLADIGYRKTRHYFTRKECELIFEYINPPLFTPKNVIYMLQKSLIRPEQLEQHGINYK